MTNNLAIAIIELIFPFIAKRRSSIRTAVQRSETEQRNSGAIETLGFQISSGRDR